MNAQNLVDNFSTHLKNVIARAISAAAYFKHPHVEPLHLLLALSEEEGSIAAEILKKCSLSDEAIRRWLKSAPLEEKSGIVPAKNRQTLPDLSRHSRDALEKSLITAHKREHNFIGTEHLLYGIVECASRPVNELLQKNKIDMKAVRRFLEASLANSGRFAYMDDMVGTLENLNDMSQGDMQGMQPVAVPSMPGNAPHRHADSRQETALEHFTIELTAPDMQSRMDPVIGRDVEIDRLISILARRTKNNPLLIGEPGVGKTAIVEGFAKKIAEGKVPDSLKRKRVLSLDLALLLSGTIYRGEFEARLKQIIDELSETDRYILFVDEIHNIIGAGSNSGTMDAANILKPALARGLLRCIGATTPTEYKRYMSNDPALERRFQSIFVEQPNEQETKEIISGLKKYYEDFHRVSIAPAAIDAAVELSARYIHDKFQPDKAIDLLDEAAARLRSHKKSTPAERRYHTAVAQYEEAVSAKQKAIDEERLQDALTLKQTAEKMDSEVRKLEKTMKELKTPRPKILARDIEEVLSLRLGIGQEVLSASDWERLARLPETLKERIVGQDEAIEAIAEALQRGHLAHTGTHRPLAAMLFAGPSGVGKTACAKALASALFHDEHALLRLDMSEYAEAHSVSKILGAPAGYVGYNDRNTIIDHIRRRPYSVVVFDEIDKAHPDVIRLLLQILDEGELTDSSGKKVHFSHTIAVLTTNLGSELFSSPNLGFGDSAAGSRRSQTKDAINNKLKETLGSALLSRIQTVAHFHPLTPEHLADLVIRHIGHINAALSDKTKISVTAHPDAVKKLVSEEYSHDLGARAIERKVEQVIHGLVADTLKKKQRKKQYTLAISSAAYKLI